MFFQLLFSIFLFQCAYSSYDVVVYRATPSGIISAIAAARENLTVALIEPGKHLGGMVSGGLSITDVGDLRVIGGYVKGDPKNRTFAIFRTHQIQNWPIFYASPKKVVKDKVVAREMAYNFVLDHFFLKHIKNVPILNLMSPKKLQKYFFSRPPCLRKFSERSKH